ncbi:hypothetical protein AUK40_02530 [Candidatus Wirthbacteria bacterium CG2_30_54_11]|uniref:Nudix hydrolase domain-containing protein n=1 Tax=Candidatus Wirthbacteria bacterium CG2_30_54_11 TaxID=1817892 RepID=A0A1J5IXA2_9BACT|nr:MAG: hypothetical protein AUK40_02530 [Candidatus Wirthbacteria bacterium CG2_30_54_11]
MSPKPIPSPCPACGRYENRVATVDAVVVREGSVLLIKRKAEPYAGCWALPGGYMEYGETAEQASLRELKEETGLTASSGSLIGVFSDPDRHPQQRIGIAFAVKEWTGTLCAGDDAGEARWFPLSALPGQLAFDHSDILKAYEAAHVRA